MWQRKKSGNVLMGTILAAIVMIFVANAYFTTLGGSFQLLKSSRTAQQAQQFAEIEANTLKLTDYDALDSLAHPRRSLTGVIEGADGWEDSIILGEEKMIGDNKQRIASIEIYKFGDTLSRYRLQVPLTSQGSGSDNQFDSNGYSRLPSGLIIQWGITRGGYKQQQHVTLPKPMPHRLLSVIISNSGPWSGHGGTQCDVSTFNWSQTGFDYFIFDDDFYFQHSFLAIGY